MGQLETRGEPLPARFRLAVEQFNRGEYFECHETLEALWRAEHGEARLLYQGILQAAVALHHAGRGNRRGAAGMLAKALPKLERFAPAAMGVDVAALARDLRRWGEGRSDDARPLIRLLR
jgi:predicted metal-dependent hydrolase